MTAKTTNKKLLAWVDEMAKLCKPDAIHWCDGSQAEYDRLCDQMVASGTLKRLNPAKRANSFRLPQSLQLHHHSLFRSSFSIIAHRHSFRYHGPRSNEH